MVGAGLVRHRRGATTCSATARRAASSSWKAATRSAAPGTCSATRASARTRTCSRSATPSGPGPATQPIADGAAIRDYIRDTARDEASPPHIRFGHRVTRGELGRGRARWTRRGRSAPAQTLRFSCRFLFFCSGYYDYDAGLRARLGRAASSFAGRIVHPQHWPADLDYAGKQVVVIGSGATAITLLPALAAEAAHVTMLQRSPSYIIALPARDALGRALQRRAAAHAGLPPDPLEEHPAVHRAVPVLAAPAAAMRKLAAAAGAQAARRRSATCATLQPRYDPGTSACASRPTPTCSAPCARGKASIVTDQIARFTPHGIRAAPPARSCRPTSWSRPPACKLQMLGGARVTVDGRPLDLADTCRYKGMMLSGLPNLAMAMGYTNASWTLKCELIARQVCRILNHMRAQRLRRLRAGAGPDAGETRPALDLTSGYVQRAAGDCRARVAQALAHLPELPAGPAVAAALAPLRDGALRFARRGR